MSNKSTPISELRTPNDHKVGDADATVREVLDEIKDESSNLEMCEGGVCGRRPSAPPPQALPPQQAPPPPRPRVMAMAPPMMGGGSLMMGGGSPMMGGGSPMMGGGMMMGGPMMGGVMMGGGGGGYVGSAPSGGGVSTLGSGGATTTLGSGGVSNVAEAGWGAWIAGRLSDQRDLFVMALVIYAMQFVDVCALLKLDKVKLLSRVPTIGAISTTVACVVAYVGLKRALR